MKQQFESLIDHMMAGGLFLEEAVELVERRMIERALERTDCNQSAAGKMLGIHRNTLRRKMVQYKLGARKEPRRTARVA